jgi:hypothetical protein
MCSSGTALEYFSMRRFAPALLLVGLLAGSCFASVPSARVRATVSEIQPDSRTADFELENGSFVAHPYVNEFFLHDASGLDELSSDDPRSEDAARHSLLSLHTVTNAASEITKKVASWGHALARLVP